MKKLILLCLALTFATVVSAQAGKKKPVEDKSRSSLYSSSKSSPSRGFSGGGRVFSSPRSNRQGSTAARNRSPRSRVQPRRRVHPRSY